MKFLKSIFLVFAFSALCSVAFAQSNPKDTFGYYSIANAPKAFANISEVHLAGNYGAEQKPPFYGLIRFKAKKSKDFILLKPKMNGKRIIFETEVTNGFKYTFDGTFSRLGDFPVENLSGQILLTGTLAKFKGKTKVARAKIKFTYEPGD
jgi:hypothetical protein